MRRVAAVGALVAVLAACGGTAASHPAAAPATTAAPTPTPTDTATVTAVLTRAAHAAHLLVHLSGGLASVESQYGLAESDARIAAGELAPAPSGVPDALARDAAAKLTAVADGLAAVLSCLQDSGGDTTGCHAVLSDVEAKAGAAGTVMADLQPYSDLTPTQLQEMVR